jgi:hypothetical protein
VVNSLTAKLEEEISKDEAPSNIIMLVDMLLSYLKLQVVRIIIFCLLSQRIFLGGIEREIATKER